MCRALQETPSQKPNGMGEAGVMAVLLFRPSQPRFARVKSSFVTCIARTEARGIFEVNLSINKRGNGRSGAVVKMRWGADTLHF